MAITAAAVKELRERTGLPMMECKKALVEAGQTVNGKGLIINSSRAVLYASNGKDFAQAARSEAIRTRDEINQYRIA